jgi:hypothetical protein
MPPGYARALVGGCIGSLKSLFESGGLLISRTQFQAYGQFHGKDFSTPFLIVKQYFREVFALFGTGKIPPHSGLTAMGGVSFSHFG